MKTPQKRGRETKVIHPKKVQKVHLKACVRFSGHKKTEDNDQDTDCNIDSTRIEEFRYLRLKDGFTKASDGFEGYVSMYLRYKKLQATIDSSTFVAPS